MSDPRDIETALILEQAVVHDIGKAVAYTDGNKIYINTEDKLNEILPAYSQGMLKWLLWHEKVHNELRHHKRYFKYLKELDEDDTLTRQEVNIIMDILVHDSLSKWFPELVETAKENLAQLRTRNSLKHTFTTFTLEEMLDEYRNAKEEPKDDGDGEDPKGTPTDGPTDGPTTDTPMDDEPKDDTKEHKKGGHREKSEKETKEDSITEDDTSEKSEEVPGSEHDEADWSKLDDRDETEFIDKDTASMLDTQINELKRKRIKLAHLTETINGLATSSRIRTYRVPSNIRVGKGTILKGHKAGKAQLYLCFDASGSMWGELHLFKEIITKSIPQAMDCPCEWFAGEYAKIKPYKVDRGNGYYKGKFRDILPVRADDGYGDDGDRTIELCWQAEQKGYSPIGITDGGGQISWSKDKLKQLKRTVFVGSHHDWLTKAKEINPAIQIIEL